MNSLTVLLDSGNGSSAAEVTLSATSLHAMLLEDGARIDPTTRLKVDGQRIALRDSPRHVPRAAMLNKALAAVRSNQPGAARMWCDRLLAFDPSRHQAESAWAWFLTGLVCHETNPEHAIRCYQTAGARPSAIRNAALTNLASLWALECAQAHLAAECLAKVLDHSPNFLPALESQRNLAEEMRRVGAPTPRGQRSWSEQFRSADSVLAARTSAGVWVYLDEESVPNYRHLRLIPKGPHSSALAANIPVSDQGAAAAELELAEARQAIADGHYETAILLARDVQQRPASAQEARQIAAEAEALMADRESLRRGRSLSQWSHRFDQSLVSGDYAGAHRAIDRLALLLTDEQLGQVQSTFQRRFVKDRLDQADDSDDLVKQATQYQAAALYDEQHHDKLQQASLNLVVHQMLEAFRREVLENADSTAAQAYLDRIKEIDAARDVTVERQLILHLQRMKAHSDACVNSRTSAS